MKSPIVFLTTLLLSGTVLAVDVVDQRYIDEMTQGGMASVKDAARSMYNTGETNTQVLDVAAEILLQNYANASDPDAMAWVAKALGRSHNGRYYNVLNEVVRSNADKKLRKHAGAALKEIGSATGDQYVKGGVDLVAVRNHKAPASRTAAKNKAAPAAAAPAAAPAATSGLDVIRKGMSMQEAFALVGAPTSSTARATGKAWIPFNYKGGDLVRSYALYKGKGRIVFSTSSRYDSTYRVVEVQIDPNERGYP